MGPGPKFGLEPAGFETELPIMQMDQQELAEEKKAARFSKTAEFKKLKEHLEQRISFYQKWLPDGRPVQETEVNDAELGSRWRAANIVITELNLIISAYEQAREVVEEDARRNNA